MTPVIKKHLTEIDDRFNVRMLYAIESGSRAWGFESKDSDFDVRFVYVGHTKDYLTIHPRRDVIENADVKAGNPILDFSGWDLKKFLGLIAKSNPIAFEWLQSTIVYHQDDEWRFVLEETIPFFSVKAAMHHYLSMARHNYREHMRDDTAPKVKLKKYLYITRPLLCCRWIERSSKLVPPPMPFNEVLAGAEIGADLKSELLALVERKKAGEELEEGPAIPLINRFIETELWRLRLIADKAALATGAMPALDILFQHFATRNYRDT